MSLKVFDLCCGNGHTFEGWFASENDYLGQLDSGLLACPLCANHQIERLPSAPRLNLGAAAPEKNVSTDEASKAAPIVAPPQLQQALIQMAREIVACTEDVGEDFAEEARRIHYDKAPERSIRGLTSQEEAEALLDEGIAVFPVPFGPLLKEPLQ